MTHHANLQTKLIVIDGIMGSGKSTTGEWIGTVMEECGIPHKFVRETERPHPVQVTGFLGRKANRVSADDHIAQSVDKWSQFVAEAERGDSITILDGQLFHFNIDLMLFLDADKEQIIRHTRGIAEITRRLQPTLIYFRGESAKSEMDEVFAARGRQFVDRQIRRKTRYPYCVNRGISGREALVRLYEDYREIADCVFSDLGWRKVLIDKRSSGWAQRNDRILRTVFGDRFRRPDVSTVERDVKVVCRDRVGLSGLADRRSIEGDFRIKNNPTLSSLREMVALKTIGGSLDLRGNPRLTSLEGLENLRIVEEYILIRYTTLRNLRGLKSLEKVGKSLVIGTNELTSLDGLECVSGTGQNLTITLNPNLQSIQGLQTVTEVGGTLTLRELPRLEKLTGLGALTNVAGDFEISYNDSLRNLSGLGSLRTIQGELRVLENSQLESLRGLSRLESVGSLNIIGNPRLPDCEIEHLQGLVG